ncbi:hypothetical protein ACT6NV_03510 [Robiginitalea sp. IMCC44478]|uniref:hypothetical protein n=1 Tax=Robiginitalea sp. IMCC44478 TaxID=3459122 RepID=UPI0040419330
MKLIRVDRKTKTEKRYSPKMGRLHTRVTYIRKSLLGIPVRTLHKYRETYYGEVKDCEDCLIAK